MENHDQKDNSRGRLKHFEMTILMLLIFITVSSFTAAGLQDDLEVLRNISVPEGIIESITVQFTNRISGNGITAYIHKDRISSGLASNAPYRHLLENLNPAWYLKISYFDGANKYRNNITVLQRRYVHLAYTDGPLKLERIRANSMKYEDDIYIYEVEDVKYYVYLLPEENYLCIADSFDAVRSVADRDADKKFSDYMDEDNPISENMYKYIIFFPRAYAKVRDGELLREGKITEEEFEELSARDETVGGSTQIVCTYQEDEYIYQKRITEYNDDHDAGEMYKHLKKKYADPKYSAVFVSQDRNKVIVTKEVTKEGYERERESAMKYKGMTEKEKMQMLLEGLRKDIREQEEGK